MARNVDVTQLKQLRDSLQKFSAAEKQQIVDGCAKELAARMLAKAVKRTPVGVYSNHVHFVTSTGKEVSFDVKKKKVGGTLRRGWTVDPLEHSGSNTKVNIHNTTEYSFYVEYGHRTPNLTGWVKGQFMMTISANEIEAAAPAIIEAKVKKALEGIF